MRVREVPEPRPGPGEVRVRVEAIGVNYAELLSRKRLYGWALALPYTLGMEATGTIEMLGAGVTQRSIGERVVVAGFASRVWAKIWKGLQQPFPEG
ncbi:hypothetical protein SD80_012765 [Scytonema tolypothrichoides VB-61278]|nr:hypothetical protein SD80_012765 [Scytonema tolypothrichoides VB-61278]